MVVSTRNRNFHKYWYCLAVFRVRRNSIPKSFRHQYGSSSDFSIRRTSHPNVSTGTAKQYFEYSTGTAKQYFEYGHFDIKFRLGPIRFVIGFIHPSKSSSKRRFRFIVHFVLIEQQFKLIIVRAYYPQYSVIQRTGDCLPP